MTKSEVEAETVEDLIAQEQKKINLFHTTTDICSLFQSDGSFESGSGSVHTKEERV